MAKDGWKTIVSGIGYVNLDSFIKRHTALSDAEKLLTSYNVPSNEVVPRIIHERQHLFGFDEFEVGSGKKLTLDLQTDGVSLRLVVVPNKIFKKEEVRRAIKAAEEQSEGDMELISLSGYRT